MCGNTVAVEAIPQVLDSSVDAAGLSIVSAQMTADDPRRGSMYNTVVMAAAVPIWFHPLQDGNFIALLRSRWINATVGAGPQSFTAHTEVVTPSWATVNPPTGHTTTLGSIPTLLPGGGRVINGAASRIDFLYTVGSLDGLALVQLHQVNPQGRIVLASEELLPVSNGVTFDKGCYIDGNYLTLFGTDGAGMLYQARRPWPRIGQPNTTGVDSWTYRGPKGWTAKTSEMESIGLHSFGPVSVAQFKDRLLLSTVAGDHTTRVFTCRVVDPWRSWKLLGNGPDLGGDGGAAYLGGGMYFQSQLDRNLAQTLPPGATAGIPYLSSTKVTAGADESINTVWGLWPL